MSLLSLASWLSVLPQTTERLIIGKPFMCVHSAFLTPRTSMLLLWHWCGPDVMIVMDGILCSTFWIASLCCALSGYSTDSEPSTRIRMLALWWWAAAQSRFWSTLLQPLLRLGCLIWPSLLANGISVFFTPTWRSLTPLLPSPSVGCIISMTAWWWFPISGATCSALRMT